MSATLDSSTTIHTTISIPSEKLHQQTPMELSEDAQRPENDEKKKTENEEENSSPKGVKLVLILITVMVSMFIVALDRTIVATVVPTISNQFHSLDDVGWYASAYLLTSCASQLLWGRFYTFYSTKTIFLVAVGIFEVGSAICGGAPNSVTFIIGRAVAGIGSAGIFSGSTVILTHIIPLEKRPIYVGLMSSMFGLSSAVGPLMGGAFADHVSWRWCFYINLPVGAVTFVVLSFYLQVSHTKVAASLRRQLIQLDPLGTTLFLPSVICFLLALQWGGTTYPWSHGRVIALFVVAGVLIIAFVGVQIWRQEDATIPPRIIKQRSIAFGTVYSMCVGGALVSMIYTLPLWFQAVKGTTAVQSGINTIPMVLALVVGVIISGGIITYTGYYVPFMFVATVLMSTGAGLITTFDIFTDQPKWIGYQVLFGLGLGAGMQQANLAAQTVLEQKDVPMGISLMFFCQSLGGAVFVCIGQSLFTNFLTSTLPGISGIDPAAILAAGVTELTRLVPTDRLSEVVVIFNDALTRAFTVAVATSCLMVLPALGMEWRSVKKNVVPKQAP